jgi:hypothetical protein
VKNTMHPSFKTFKTFKSTGFDTLLQLLQLLQVLLRENVAWTLFIQHSSNWTFVGKME